MGIKMYYFITKLNKLNKNILYIDNGILVCKVI